MKPSAFSLSYLSVHRRHHSIDIEREEFLRLVQIGGGGSIEWVLLRPLEVRAGRQDPGGEVGLADVVALQDLGVPVQLVVLHALGEGWRVFDRNARVLREDGGHVCHGGVLHESVQEPPERKTQFQRTQIETVRGIEKSQGDLLSIET